MWHIFLCVFDEILHSEQIEKYAQHIFMPIIWYMIGRLCVCGKRVRTNRLLWEIRSEPHGKIQIKWFAPRKLQEMGIQICASMVWFSINTDVWCAFKAFALTFKWGCCDWLEMYYRLNEHHKSSISRQVDLFISPPRHTHALSRWCVYLVIFCTNIYLYLTQNTYRQIDNALNWCQIYGCTMNLMYWKCEWLF